MRAGWVLCLGLLACGGQDDEGIVDDTGPDDKGGACGAVTEHDLLVRGKVVDGGSPVEGADIRLEERAWHAGVETFGHAVTGPDGRFEFEANGIVSVEDCWGTALDYVIVAVRGDQQAEDGINSRLYGAIHDGVSIVDLSDFPLEL